MGIVKTAKGLTSALIGIAFLAALALVVLLFVKGAVWASEEVWPLVPAVFGWTFTIAALLLVTTGPFRATRGFCAISLLLASFIFGAVLWVGALLLTLQYWGRAAVAIGLLIAGIGLVPMAFLASMFRGEWLDVGGLMVMILLTFGTRALALWFGERPGS